MSNHSSLLIALLVAPLAWGGLLLFTYFMSPQAPLAFIVFPFILIALTCTFMPVAYLIGSRLFSSQIYRATSRHALRQGVLLSLVIVLNLILRTLHSWSILTAIVILVVAIVIEVLSLARK